MTRPLSSRERKLLALALLAGVVGIAWLAVVAPIAAGFAEREQRRAQLAIVYAHNQRTIGAIPRARRQAERQRAAIADFVIEARGVEDARERLKEQLQRAIESTGGEFRESGDGESRPGWARVRALARGTLPQLIAALARLQNEPPYLIVESLTVAADEALVTGRPSTLDIQLEASIPLRPAAAR